MIIDDVSSFCERILHQYCGVFCFRVCDPLEIAFLKALEIVDAQTPMLYAHVPPLWIYVGADFLQTFFIVANDEISHLLQDGVPPVQNCQQFFAKDLVDCVGQSQVLRGV